jgi:hypothetical protein
VYTRRTIFTTGLMRFSKRISAIITEVDASSGQDERNIPSRSVRFHTTPQRGDNTKTTTFLQIVEFPCRAELHDDVGIVHIEIVPGAFTSARWKMRMRRRESTCWSEPSV